MPVITTCSACGKKLKIRDELVGKKLKCPACGAVFTGQADAMTPGPKHSVIRPAPPAQTSNDSPGKSVPSKASSRPADDDDRPRAKNKKRGSKKGVAPRVWIWVGIIGAAVIVLVVGKYLQNRPGKSGPGDAVAAKPEPEYVRRKAAFVAREKKSILEISAGSDALADLVPGDAFAFISISGDFWNAPGLATLHKTAAKPINDSFLYNLGMPVDKVERITFFTVKSFTDTQKNNWFPFMVALKSKSPLDKEAVARALRRGALGNFEQNLVAFASDTTALVGGPDQFLEFEAKRGKTKPTGALAKALVKAESSKGVVAMMNNSPEAVQWATSKLTLLPASMPSPAPLLKSKAVLATLEVSKRADVSVFLFTDNSADVKEIKGTVDGLIKFAGHFLDDLPKSPASAVVVALGRQALKELKVDVGKADLAISVPVDANIATALLVPAVLKVRAAAGLNQDASNLKQIGLAWRNYHLMHRSFPAQSLHKHLSWRVAILPLLGHDALYKKFKLDEPWDGPSNAKLIPLMPKTYESPLRAAEAGQTYYETFVGPKTINADATKGIKMTEILDGTANTIIVTEAATPVPWTKPDDIMVDPTRPVLLGGSYPNALLVLFADTSVRALPRNLDQSILRLLIDPADGKPIPRLDGGPKGKK